MPRVFFIRTIYKDDYTATKYFDFYYLHLKYVQLSRAWLTVSHISVKFFNIIFHAVLLFPSEYFPPWLITELSNYIDK